MPYRPHGRAKLNPAYGAWAICDRCGGLYSQSDLTWQYDYQGGQTPVNLRLLVCRRTCLDDLNYNNKLLILPPDPPPIFNARPEAYAVDETNWLTTEGDEDILTTQSGTDLITSIPSPDVSANICNLRSVILNPTDDITSVAYLDLFDGDPSNGGTSILEAITGSATRTNIYDDLADIPPELVGLPDTFTVTANPDVIAVTSASLATINVSWIGIYSASTGGTLLASAAVSANYPTIVEGAAVQFLGLDLIIKVPV